MPTAVTYDTLTAPNQAPILRALAEEFSRRISDINQQILLGECQSQEVYRRMLAERDQVQWCLDCVSRAHVKLTGEKPY